LFGHAWGYQHQFTGEQTGDDLRLRFSNVSVDEETGHLKEKYDIVEEKCLIEV
jgi:hypothetical protein